MKRVELYARVRHAVMIEGLSQREAARRFGIDPRTVKKMLRYSVPPGYVRRRPPARPKLDPFIGVIDRILDEDKERPKKQRHTSKRISYRAKSWDKVRRVVAKVEWHPGELVPRVGFIVTNLSRSRAAITPAAMI